MSFPPTYVLHQHGTDAFGYRFEDVERRPAFTIDRVAQDPNLIIKLSRRDEWALQHPDIMGPRNAYFYFGPNNAPGQLAYGNAKPNGMAVYIRRKKDTSNSRYFTAQSGKEFKWKIVSSQRMECCDARSVIAVWEIVEADAGYDARLTLTQTGLTLATEILTTLTLNHMARRLAW